MKTIEEFLKNYDFNFLSEEVKVEEPYHNVWKEVYLPSQEKKSIENKLSEDIKRRAFNGLSKRGKFLCDIYDYFECNNVAEVGTAEGFQLYTFCNHLKLKDKKCKVYSCDIRDARNKDYVGKFKEFEDFTLGTSKEMSEKIVKDDQKIDLFWIDGAHHTSSVINDVIRLSKTQSKNCIWLFDDFDERFGIYQELHYLSTFNEAHSLTLGPTASGKPNNMMLLKGMI